MFLLAAAASAGAANPSVLGMFPKQTSRFAYADMKSARQHAWFAQMQQQVMPVDQWPFRQFVGDTALDPNKQVDEIYWGQVAIPDGGEQVLGVTLGQFDIASTEDHLKSVKAPFIEYQGFHLYSFGTGLGANDVLFMFIDSGTAAFGQPAALKQLIDVRTGVAEGFFQNDTLFPLVNAAGGNDILWAALDPQSAQEALRRFIPEAGLFPQIAALGGHLQSLIVQLEANGAGADDDDIGVTFEVVCGSPDDANLLAVALQAALMLRHAQASSGDSPFTVILDQARVTPRGDRLDLQFSFTQEQLPILRVLAGISQQ